MSKSRSFLQHLFCCDCYRVPRCASILVSYLLVICFFFCFSIILPNFAVFVEERGGSGFYYGLVLGIFAFGQMIGVVLSGHSSDKFGRKIVLAVTLSMIVISMLILAFITEIWHLVTLRAIQGFFASAFPVCQAFIMDAVKPAHRSFHLVLTTASLYCGLFLGPLVTGTIAAYGWMPPPLIASGFSFICLLLTLFFFQNASQSKIQPTPTSTHTPTHTQPHTETTPVQDLPTSTQTQTQTQVPIQGDPEKEQDSFSERTEGLCEETTTLHENNALHHENDAGLPQGQSQNDFDTEEAGAGGQIVECEGQGETHEEEQGRREDDCSSPRVVPVCMERESSELSNPPLQRTSNDNVPQLSSSSSLSPNDTPKESLPLSETQPTPQSTQPSLLALLKKPFQSFLLFRLLLAHFTVFLSSINIVFLFPLTVLKDLQIQAAQILGYLFFVAYGISCVVQIALVTVLGKWIGHFWVVMMCHGCTMGCTVMLFFPSTVGYAYLTSVVFGFANAFGPSASTVIISGQASVHDRGGIMGIAECMSGFARGLGPIVSGLIYEACPDAVLYTNLGISLCGALLLATTVRRTGGPLFKKHGCATRCCCCCAQGNAKAQARAKDTECVSVSVSVRVGECEEAQSERKESHESTAEAIV